jgi:hypothetical protein
VFVATRKQLAVKVKRKPKKRRPNSFKSSKADIARFETDIISQQVGVPTDT